MQSSKNLFVIGVDVGTGSARAALVNSTGKVLETCVKPIRTWNDQPNYYEQSSDDIWRAVCHCVKTVCNGYKKDDIKGIGFDATCSLVALDKNMQPLTVSPSSNDHQRNVILWMDHRAEEEARTINATRHWMLNYVGGSISLEMQLPKLLWLKRHMPQTVSSLAGAFFDLPDYLTYRATGDDSRSICSAVCKWNYDAEQRAWCDEFLQQVDLSAELSRADWKLIGRRVLDPGTPIGKGLSDAAARELDLLPGTAVATSMIDAHAGALALFGCRRESETGDGEKVTSKMAIICGTSSCHMSLTEKSVMAPGIWGPYKHAIIPDLYLNEAGQSATGVLIDHVVQTHPCYGALLQAHGSNGAIYVHLNTLLLRLAEERTGGSLHRLTIDLHVWPDFHGNRSPLADPNLTGMICGLRMTKDVESLALLYLALMQALAYGTRHILDVLQSSGREPITSILLCGGLSKNSLFVQTHADVCSIPVLLPTEPEAVLLGSAMMGAYAAGLYESLQSAASSMGGNATIVAPDLSEATRDYHERKYRIFQRMYLDQRGYERIMKG
ncbi:FGGY carbohydrate kinase domain-containing protein-like isoform X1 [Anopheles albimanus]|uniref:FGGY carbohydrate kinase domain-containing protein n=2 Tax=Anopheles albimanus TaxID=7167 RepID=A0A1I8JSR1_ANOAL|nr:FGGY carbohydrate kinase domain-containing protein-like isoform X1 [Anopheles albimanus]